MKLEEREINESSQMEQFGTGMKNGLHIRQSTVGMSKACGQKFPVVVTSIVSKGVPMVI